MESATEMYDVNKLIGFRGEKVNSTVELIYDAECPNVATTRTHLLRAFEQVGMTPHWQEWERSAKTTPDYARAVLRRCW